MMRFRVLFPVLLSAVTSWTLPAQTNSLGAVVKIDSSARILILKTDPGPEVSVHILPDARIRRVAPGETNLNNAATIALTDISAGDRVLARGQSENQTVSASLIVVISQGDIAKKQAAERAAWETNGVMGVVTTVGSGSITIRSRTASGAGSITISPIANTIVRRYAPDSVSFAEAQPAKWMDIKIGDQVRARGEKSADGARLTAEEVIAGTFQTIAGLVISVDAQAGEARITNLASKKVVTVAVNASSKVHKLSAQTAQTVAAQVHAPASGSPDLQHILEGSAHITLADLKAGDAIVVSSTLGASAERVTAIELLAGVEPILTKPGGKEMSLGSWSLEPGASGQ